LQNTKFENCKILGINFSEAMQLTFSPEFEECLISNCSFSNLKMPKTKFENCKIVSTDFNDSNLIECNFENATFEDTHFSNCNLNKASFIRAKNYTIDPTENQMKKAKFSFPDVITLLDKFDLEIE
jgi:uncharacterized protein YjbI with pentapeptide repeats